MTMLNFNFLNNCRYWGQALDKINHEMSWKMDDFRQSLAANNVDACVWMAEELQNLQTEHESLKKNDLHIIVLHSWLGLPLVPILCENFNIARLHLIDLDQEALEISKVLHKHYIHDKRIELVHHALDIPFEFERINKIPADIVISLVTEQMYPLADLKVSTPNSYEIVNNGAFYICQNSNITEEMYGINCVNSQEELIEQVGLKQVWFKGQIAQSYYSWDGLKKFDRYMVMGTKLKL